MPAGYTFISSTNHECDPTCGTPLNTSVAASMPCSPGGLCNGASTAACLMVAVLEGVSSTWPRGTGAGSGSHPHIYNYNYLVGGLTGRALKNRYS